KSETSGASEYAVSPNGKLMAFVVRGDVFIKEVDKEESKSKNLTNDPGSRDQMVTFLNDSTLIFVSDKYDQNDLFMIRSADEKQPNLFKSLKHKIERLTSTDGEERNPVISPDLKKIAYVVGRGELIVADISADGKLSNSKTLLDGWDTPGSIAWSPDSKWLAYQLSDLYFNSEIYIHAVDGSKDPVNVSMHPRGDYSPFWSKDGSKLGFSSARNNSNYDVWFTWLKKEDFEKTKDDWKEKDDDGDKKKDKKKDDDKDEKKDEVEPIVIDFENIHRRLTQVTSMTGDESSFVISNDGETFLFTGDSKTDNGTDLYSVKWDGKDLKVVLGGGKSPSGFYLDPEGKYMYFMKRGGSIGRFDVGASKDESLPYKADLKVDYYAEQDQVFDEAWRALDLNFYDPDFHGRDFEALKKKYKPWAMQTSTKQDFQTVYNEMLGQINASHMGLYGVPDRAETQKDRTGLLGIEIEPVDDGIKVLRVVPNTPADKERSKLFVGDVITSVDGNKIDNKVNFFSYFNSKADEKVLLTVNGKDGEREVVIRPTNSVNNDLYEEWVDDRRKLTEEYSDGRLGYIHIRGMSMPSFEVFERELTASGLGKEGIVIDVRFNGGGWTTDYLMTILNYKQHAYTIPRGAAEDLEKEKTKFRDYYPLGERLPFAAWIKPSIALCNQNSYSNAEIFSHAYKQLGIGTLVGIPTFGAVISTGAQGLVDGSYVRLPGRGWYVKSDDKNMDFVPAVPDIIIDDAPDSKAKGDDPQLRAAVNELLKQIDGK
ncbi:MAG: PDZ domain-containing protein, partial [Ignavibacteriales bacterium]